MPPLLHDLSTTIRLPADRQIRLERIRSEASDAAARATNGKALEHVHDPAAAVVQALAAPLEFPPLAQATVPGDYAAIAVDETVPAAAAIVRGAIKSFVAAGIEPDAISVVVTGAELSQSLQEELGGDKMARFVVHDPDDERNLCPVAYSEEQGPLVFNRALFEADIVLPISCIRPDGGSAYDCLFPRFSDRASIDRHRTPAESFSLEAQVDRQREADEAGWLLGAPLVVQVVPGGAGRIAHVLAGEPAAVAQRGRELHQQRWAFRAPRRASLVIATITGGPHDQSWESVGRALAAAEQVVADHGAVAICTELDARLGPSLEQLVDCDDLEAAERNLSREHAADSWSAWQLARAIQRGPVYFMSRLDPQSVEDLGLAPVANLDELARLADRHESCIVLDDAQYAEATVGEG
jgi:nickel-dependent lactate racemase